jgi:hypothetical protein
LDYRVRFECTFTTRCGFGKVIKRRRSQRWVKTSEDECKRAKMSVNEWRWVKTSEDEWKRVKMSVHEWRWVYTSEDVVFLYYFQKTFSFLSHRFLSFWGGAFWKLCIFNFGIESTSYCLHTNCVNLCSDSHLCWFNIFWRFSTFQTFSCLHSF